ncbi:hypothetical protein COU15_00155 [Candidatus Kaiserbacteria bacterium CG10_big_fil_rev_8_21_14_0_10_45_20]|uniref:Uncharacterized protein n=1 Tax=Candidatus Kaiserbacteria bacterium CG10_big_fil_rev_8_21_14_0_10_45_20 TaxID=1974607 RepID=A0A2H0UGE8_9BACT|nr:MAG: hypothetical protein COU15_00155 [Candidatus Kaiserbacteria bacterium CG10_big_fil_rev_8_21_14_0_10_45_20]
MKERGPDVVWDDEYHLCGLAEPRMRKSIKGKKVILVDDCFLLKFEGCLAGLPLEDRGEFKKGWWYCPHDKDVRTRWRDLFEEGSLIETGLTGEWVRVREVIEGKPALTEYAKRQSEKLKNQKLSKWNILRRNKKTRVEIITGALSI